MKYFMILFLIVISISLCGQQIDYSSWKEESKNNIRLLPEYGNIPKNEGQKEADENFIKTSILQDGTREKASQHLVELGFKYLYQHDLRIAMYRFNQAWLLNPQNEDAFWGFGAVYFMFNDYASAMDQYNKGLSINPNSANLLTDKATIYLSIFNNNGGQSNLDSATYIFNNSYSINSQNKNTLFKLSVCYYLSNDCVRAMKYYNECKMLGGNTITKEYDEAIRQKCGK